ncbi:unnamed protein product [Chilo suppressalis]|uniref:WD repeat-containing protein 18 n=1 Tax=Chilo suppressalis TaxID=168631 RepID=A0ABN8AU69_CHISP|nr:unnamed protein product [Chilo suppressalis]
MCSLLEVLVTCDSNNTLWTSSIWDPHTGTNLMTYKGGGTAETKTLSFIGNDYVAAAERTKPILHVWPVNSQQTVQGMRFILPGKAGAVSVTSDGSFLAAGIDEKIYLWQISSGSLLTIINRHYQKIVLLKFTSDGKFFISAAEDGMVMVWSLATVATHPEVDLVTQTTAGQHDPVYIFSDHSLPVTDLCVSKIGMHGRLATISSDRTCKIYDLSSGEMLLNIVFDVPLSAITMDVLELNLFIGTTEGKIHQFNLASPPRTRDFLLNTDANTPIFEAHTKTVTCLSVSVDGETLMSGSSDEQIILWHIPSKQAVRTIRHKGPITNAFFTTNFPAIYKQNFSPNIILHSLERNLDKEEEDINVIELLVNKKVDFWPERREDLDESYLPSKELENEYKLKHMALEEELIKMKKINANLYAFSVKKALVSSDNNNKRKKKKKTAF